MRFLWPADKGPPFPAGIHIESRFFESKGRSTAARDLHVRQLLGLLNLCDPESQEGTYESHVYTHLRVIFRVRYFILL